MCDAVWFGGKRRPTPSEEATLPFGVTLEPLRWEQQVPPELWYLHTKLHGITFKKMLIFISIFSHVTKLTVLQTTD
jgi:hypothetical protein